MEKIEYDEIYEDTATLIEKRQTKRDGIMQANLGSHFIRGDF